MVSMRKNLGKLLALLLAAMMLALPLSSCGKEEGGASSAQPASSAAGPKTEVRLATLKGPTGIGMTYLLEKAEAKTALNDYSYVIANAPDEISARLVAGEYDIAAVPTNLAATLYNASNGKVKLLNLNTLGVLYVLEKGDSIKSLADLSGKTIYVSGQAATPEYVLDYLLEANGVEDVDIEFVADHAALATMATSGKADICMLPEPNVTAVVTQDKDIRVALNMTDEWNKTVEKKGLGGSVLSMGCVVVRTEFAEKNPDAVKNFMTEYKESVEKVNADVDGAAQLCERFEIVPKAAIAKQAIPRCNIVYIDGEQMKTQVENFYKVLFDANPKSVGGKLPDANFYY